MTDPSTSLGQDRRFIEESFPVKEVGEVSAREKNIRHGNISTLHTWWARRPLAASRATAYAALTPADKSITEWQGRRDFIVELSRRENSLDRTLLSRARHDILETSNGKSPRVLDPFAGGGAIPLEALRLGCETYASDYNPVAVLLLKATLEYPQKYGHPVEAEASGDLFGGQVKGTRTGSPLLETVKAWGDWVLEEAQEELAEFYPPDPDGSIPVGYIWARTIPCQNPACGAEIPLMRQFWLAKKARKKVALYPVVEQVQTLRVLETLRVSFRIVGDGYDPWPEGFDPGEGTVARAVATCPMCGGMVEAKTTHRLFREGKARQRMVAVVLAHPQRRGKTYRVATAADEAVYQRAEKALHVKREALMLAWGMDPVPCEPLPYDPRNVWVTPYFPADRQQWGSLFNARQLLTLITFAAKVRLAHERMVAEGIGREFAKAVATYLALRVDMTAAFTNTLAR